MAPRWKPTTKWHTFSGFAWDMDAFIQTQEEIHTFPKVSMKPLMQFEAFSTAQHWITQPAT